VSGNRLGLFALALSLSLSLSNSPFQFQFLSVSKTFSFSFSVSSQVKTTVFKRMWLNWNEKLKVLEDLDNGGTSIKACARTHNLAPKNV
jgi:hypothetical protein